MLLWLEPSKHLSGAEGENPINPYIFIKDNKEIGYITKDGLFHFVRKITPREAWRLMDFDDFYFDRASKVNSKTQLYKQAGNSIVVNVLYEILRVLFIFINNEI